MQKCLRHLLAYFHLRDKGSRVADHVAWFRDNGFMEADYTVSKEGLKEIRPLIAGKDDLSGLYDRLKDIFPSGNQDGTGYPWRGVKSIAVKKLAKIMADNGITEDDVIGAAELYWSPQFDSRRRRILTYFISKKEKGGEETSDLLEMVQRLRNGESGQGNMSEDLVFAR